MKSNLTLRGNVLHGNPHTRFEDRQKAIDKANKEGIDYGVVRTVQQAYPSHIPAVRHHIHQFSSCRACRLGCNPFVQNKVFYRGYVPCDVLFVGEAPGVNEDAQVRPFIGNGGKVLDGIITEVSRRLTENTAELALSTLARDNAFRWCITNSVLCTPFDSSAESGIRIPASDEVKACSSRLYTFIHICAPAVIVPMGMVAERAMRNFTVRHLKPNDPPLEELDSKITFNPGSEPHEGFSPIIRSIPHPDWMIRQKDFDLVKKKAVLVLVETLRPLFQGT